MAPCVSFFRSSLRNYAALVVPGSSSGGVFLSPNTVTRNCYFIINGMKSSSDNKQPNTTVLTWRSIPTSLDVLVQLWGKGSLGSWAAGKTWHLACCQPKPKPKRYTSNLLLCFLPIGWRPQIKSFHAVTSFEIISNQICVLFRNVLCLSRKLVRK